MKLTYDWTEGGFGGKCNSFMKLLRCLYKVYNLEEITKAGHGGAYTPHPSGGRRTMNSQTVWVALGHPVSKNKQIN